MSACIRAANMFFFSSQHDPPVRATRSPALESSLWELSALERHYPPAVSTLAKSVGTEDDSTTPMHDVEEFMAHTYKSLFDQERKRLGGEGGSAAGRAKNKRRKVALTFEEPAGLFGGEDVFGGSFKCS